MIKQKKYLIIFICIFALFATSKSFANKSYSEINLQEKPLPAENPGFKKEKGVLVGGVSVTKDLPQAFYGTWTVLSELIETNNPVLFRKKSSDIWSFQRKNNVITLSNPVSGAIASITVTEVRNNTAVFTRVSRDNNVYEIETPEITVEGDSFYGTDTIIIKHFRKGDRVKTDKVKYKVKGYKISGPTLKDIFAK